MTSPVEIRDALIAYLNAGGAAVTAKAHTRQELDDLGDQVPEWYTEVWLMERASANGRRIGGRGTSREYALLTRAVGKVEDNAEGARARAAARLDEVIVTLAGVQCTITRETTDDPIAPDDGWYSGLSEWLLCT